MTEISIFPTAFICGLLLLPLLHYIADFELQTNWMAINKSKRIDALFVHVMIYGGVFGLVFGWKFSVVTFVLHFLTDLVTSRWSSYYFTRDRHRFFCIIGFDQMLHAYSLVATAVWLNTKPWWM